MRLICPNCGAQYEVPADVIPEGGRDVQCSNCAHTWFQAHPDDDHDLAEDLNQPMPDRAWDEDAGRDEESAFEDEAWDEPADPAPRPAAARERVSAEPPPPPPEDAAPEPAPSGTRGRAIDPEVAELLREERELERRRRAAEAQSLESQPDLGLQEPDEYERSRREREARERMARLRGTDPEDDPDAAVPPQQQKRNGRAAAVAAAAAAAGSRRELLPDVEEINQTLRAGSEKRAVDEAERYEAPDKRRAGSGFSRGFFLVVLLVAIAVALYAFSPQIKGAVPQAGDALDGYVVQVDAMRQWLDGQVARLMTTLDSMSSEAAPPEAEGGS